jgi:microcystin degradation protein MlrC
MHETAMMRKRVVVAGLYHETHTFLDGTTGLDDFALREGTRLLDAAGDGSPLSGVLDVARRCRWDVVPAIDLRATASATVDDAVFDFFWNRFTSTVEEGRGTGIDGVFLVLHGAMVCRNILDVEGELMKRLRSLAGCEQVPVCGVLDPHGNISRSMIERSQGFVAYRTTPHVDAREAAVDGALLLDRVLSSRHRPVAVYESCPVMWPPTGTGTADEPLRTLLSMARQIERDHPEIAAVNVMSGFSFADTHDTGVSLSAVTFGDPHVARRRLRELREYAMAHRSEGNVVEPPLEEVMPDVLQDIAWRRIPVALVEPADNIGGGAPGDGPTVLRTLLEHGAQNAAVVINDPEAVAALSNLRRRDHLRLGLGGKASRFTEPPVVLEVELISRSDGRFELEDRQSHLASMSGVRVDMGPCAVVRDRGVTILITSKKTPPFDLGQLRSQGIVPESLSVIGIKAAVAHRRAYDRITKSSFTVATPGPCSSDLRRFPFQHVRRPIYPLEERMKDEG